MTRRSRWRLVLRWIFAAESTLSTPLRWSLSTADQKLVWIRPSAKLAVYIVSFTHTAYLSVCDRKLNLLSFLETYIIKPIYWPQQKLFPSQIISGAVSIQLRISHCQLHNGLNWQGGSKNEHQEWHLQNSFLIILLPNISSPVTLSGTVWYSITMPCTPTIKLA